MNPKKSPFPGMDPFLEKPSRWSSVHARLITEMSNVLSDLVSPHFYVDIEQRVYITTPNDDPVKQGIVPDLYISQPPDSGGFMPSMTAEITPATILEPIYEERIVDRFLEITNARTQEVVTIIELLSPFNKVDTAKGFKAFYKKREEVFRSNVHWLEIDLLRKGKRPDEIASDSDYYVLLKRSKQSHREIWYIDLRDKLPTVAIPLTPTFADIPLDLQLAFENMYAHAYYGRKEDYEKHVPAPPLSATDGDWVRKQIKTWRESEVE